MEKKFKRTTVTSALPYANGPVHISSLEKELNARLFVRNTKEVKLSDDGKDLYRYARQMIDLQKKIKK